MPLSLYASRLASTGHVDQSISGLIPYSLSLAVFPCTAFPPKKRASELLKAAPLRSPILWSLMPLPHVKASGHTDGTQHGSNDFGGGGGGDLGQRRGGSGLVWPPPPPPSSRCNSSWGAFIPLVQIPPAGRRERLGSVSQPVTNRYSSLHCWPHTGQHASLGHLLAGWLLCSHVSRAKRDMCCTHTHTHTHTHTSKLCGR